MAPIPNTIFEQYDVHSLQSFPIKRVVTGELASDYFHKLEEYADLAITPVSGHYLMTRQLYDWSFLVYAYRFDGTTYAFAWETPYDEMHRGYRGGPSTWYDEISQGQPIAIKVNPRAPHEHFIVDEVFHHANQGVTFLDPEAAE